MDLDPSTTKYLIKAKLKADGVVEKPDVVGAIFGQTEGLLGNELDLRDLQKSGRIGRIEVDVESKQGKSRGTITLPSSLDKVETAILASALESIDRVGPCEAKIKIDTINDVRTTKRQQVIERAKELLHDIIEDSKDESADITETVRQTVRVEEIEQYGPDQCPAGPNVGKSDSVVLVEGRSDVLNLLRYGIKNAIAAEGTDIPDTIRQLTSERVATAFVDGDRGGELIVTELLQTCEVDFVAEAPENEEVEELTQKQIMKALRNKIPAAQYVEMYDIDADVDEAPTGDPQSAAPAAGAAQATQATSGSASQATQSTGGTQQTQQASNGGQTTQQKSEEAPATGEEARFSELLEGLSGQLEAVLLDGDLQEVGDRIAVRDLADALKDGAPDEVDTVVFDGVVTQRLLDIAAEKDISTLVGVKTGNVTKKPESVRVLTRDDVGS
jgi:DNA primase